MRQAPASLIKYTASILIFLSRLLIPLTSAFALGVTIRGPKEALISEKADFSVSVACDATIESVEWRFGDTDGDSGSTSTSHTYKELGDFTVKVTVIVSYTDKEGNQKTDTGSDSHQITINAKLKLSAKPTIIPADGKSTTTITAEVLDYKGNTVPSYNKTLNLSSSNQNALTLPESVKAEKGKATIIATSGEEPDIVVITANGRYVDEANCEAIIFKVTLAADPFYIAAETNWPKINDDLQRSKITVNVEPKVAEAEVIDDISLEVKEVEGEKSYNPGEGKLVKKSKIDWTYISFEEPKTEKNPKTKDVWVVAEYKKQECGDAIKITVKPVFLLLTTGYSIKDKYHKPTKDDYSLAWKYARWKYNISTSNLTSIAYSPGLHGKRRGEVRTGVGGIGRYCKLGPGAFQAENICASVLGHENVHGGQHWWYFLPGMEAKAEIPAYQWEINHANQTGVEGWYIQECKDWLRYYENKGPKPK